MFSRLSDRLDVDERRFAVIAWITLIALGLIVLTGAAVRLTDSGLGCPTWPKCYGKVLPPLKTHALIEFGNRALSGLVGVITGVTAVVAFMRRPFRRDLALLAVALPLGVIGQAVLGGFTVREKLAPGFVMGHFGLSMIILVAAVALVWRATHEPGSRPRSVERVSVWAVRVVAALGGLTIFVGTAATAAGPHSGGFVGQHIKRLHFKGADTLTWIVHQHATIAALFGVAAVATWLWQRHRGAVESALEPMTVVCILIAAQGLVGSVQYELHLPTDMVWVHVMLATVTWIAVLWSVAAAGRLAPRVRSVRASDASPEPSQARALATR
jgi:cytochrome c oxidase assembly protein subunit 15